MSSSALVGKEKEAAQVFQTSLSVQAHKHLALNVTVLTDGMNFSPRQNKD